MAQVAITTRVAFRNDMGQFASDCAAAAGESIAEAIMQGAEISRTMAPEGTKRDPRYPLTLKESIEPVQTSRTQGFWGASAPWALHVEKGTSQHPQTIKVAFFWEKMGRDWDPREWYPGQKIDHPATAAQPYLEPAFKIIRRRLRGIMDKHYPG